MLLEGEAVHHIANKAMKFVIPTLQDEHNVMYEESEEKH